MVETVTLSNASKTYTAIQVMKIFDDAWTEARADLVRELEQQQDERSELNILAQLRTLTKAKGRVNVRIKR